MHKSLTYINIPVDPLILATILFDIVFKTNKTIWKYGLDFSGTEHLAGK